MVDNAIEFTPSEGGVAVRVFDGPTVGVEVRDSGPDIPEAERNLVLRRLHRGERSRPTPGSGLLAAVAKLHKLTLVIEDGNPGCSVRLWRDAPGFVSACCPMGPNNRRPPLGSDRRANLRLNRGRLQERPQHRIGALRAQPVPSVPRGRLVDAVTTSDAPGQNAALNSRADASSRLAQGLAPRVGQRFHQGIDISIAVQRRRR